MIHAMVQIINIAAIGIVINPILSMSKLDNSAIFNFGTQFSSDLDETSLSVLKAIKMTSVIDISTVSVFTLVSLLHMYLPLIVEAANNVRFGPVVCNMSASK